MSNGNTNNTVFIQKLFTSRDNFVDGNVQEATANAANFVGQEGRIWWNPDLNAFYYSDGNTPGGFLINGPVGNGQPGGPVNAVQINNGDGNFYGSANFIFDGSNANLAGNVNASYFIGNGSQLTDINTNKIFNDTSYANIENPNGNLEVNINSYSWIFDSTGNLTVPANSTISPLSDDLTLDAGGNVYIKSKGHTFLFDSDTVGRLIMPPSGIIAVDDAVGNGLNLFVGNTSTEVGNTWNFGVAGNLTLPDGSTIINGFISGAPGQAAGITNGDTGYQQFYAQDDGAYVQTSVGNAGIVFNTWQFGLDGNLTTPGNIIIDVAGNANVSSDSNINIISNGNIWNFGTDGNLTLPGNGGITFADNTYQNTAFNDTSAVTSVTVGVGLSQTTTVGDVGIDAIGVQSITGTANRIIVTDLGGQNFNISAPQDLNTSSTLTFANLTITGNLTVNGTTTTANSANLDSKVLYLAANSTSNSQIDQGGIVLGNNSSSYKVSILYDLPNNAWNTDGANLTTLDFNAANASIDFLNVQNGGHFGLLNEALDYPNAYVQVDANVNSYSQIISQNHSLGTQASSDLVLVNDIGDDGNHFIDLGINGSNYTDPAFSSTLANDGYLYMNKGNLVIGTDTAAKTIKFVAGGTTSNDIVLTISNTGLVTPGNSQANYFIGNGSRLTGLPAGNIVGQVANALVAGTVYTNAQPNITSVGTLTGLTSNGVVNFANASNVNIGSVANLHIAGGGANYILQTNGSNTLSWVVNPGVGAITTILPNALNSSNHIAATTVGNTATIITDATTANTANTIVVRDANGAINVSGWTVGTHLTAVNYTATNSDYWIGTTTKNKTITLPNAANGASTGRQYQIADAVHTGNPGTTIAAQSPATVVGNQPSQQGQIIIATYVGTTWYLN